MDFHCNFDELDYTRMISQGLKLETIRLILGIEEIADIEKVLILKKLLGVEAPRVEEVDEDDWK